MTGLSHHDSFGGLTAIVTGGSSGIGAATVATLRSRGATVTILDVEAPPDGTPYIPVDVGDTQSVTAGVSTAVSQFCDRLDIVVNNAGVGSVGPVQQSTDDEWHHVLNVNVIGMARVVRAALPHLLQSDHASIVNVSSIAATAGLPNRAVYSASKGAVFSLTLAMAADYCAHNIRVNCVCPGTVDTPWVSRLLDAAPEPTRERAALEARQPLGRLGTPAEVANAIAFLAAPENSWMTGTALALDGGMQGLRIRPEQ